MVVIAAGVCVCVRGRERGEGSVGSVRVSSGCN